MKNKLQKILPSKKAVLVCQFGQDVFKAIKFLPGKREIMALQTGNLTAVPAEEEYAGIISALLKKPAYQGLAIIVCLPRYRVTFRMLKKVPAHSPKEIESIVRLQAPRSMPYPAEELISGHQVISVDQEGYSDINMAVVHKEAVERVLNAFKGQKYPSIILAVSSYGLLNLYNYLRPNDAQVTMLIDADAGYPEVAIVRGRSVLFSRSFKLDRAAAGWQDVFISEVNKTKSAHLKEMPAMPASKIVLLGAGNIREEFLQVLSKRQELPVSSHGYGPVKLLEIDMDTDRSLAALIGLGIKRVPESLNLMPTIIKRANEKTGRRQEWARLGLWMCAVIFITALAINRTMDNKAAYLARLRAEVNKIAQEARPLEDIDRRLKAIKERSRKSPTVLEALQELYRIIPGSIALASFSYNQGDEVIIRGQAPELEFVFAFATAIESSGIFADFSVKVKYATKKLTASGQVCDFEIDCRRRKQDAEDIQ